jgi:hypothetical protein
MKGGYGLINMMYRIRPGCAVYVPMNISVDQVRRMMYIGEKLYGKICNEKNPLGYF